MTDPSHLNAIKEREKKERTEWSGDSHSSFFFLCFGAGFGGQY